MLMALAVQLSVPSVPCLLSFHHFPAGGRIYLPTAARFYVHAVAVSRLVAGRVGAGGATR